MSLNGKYTVEKSNLLNQTLINLENANILEWKGSYISTYEYGLNDIVNYNGCSYICKIQNTGVLPTSSTLYWDVFVQTGGTGSGSFVWKGDYSATNPYAINDIVYLNGCSYICKVTSIGVSPPTDTVKWSILVAKGDIGLTGATGLTGETGAAGDTTAAEAIAGGAVTAAGGALAGALASASSAATSAGAATISAEAATAASSSATSAINAANDAKDKAKYAADKSDATQTNLNDIINTHIAHFDTTYVGQDPRTSVLGLFLVKNGIDSENGSSFGDYKQGILGVGTPNSAWTFTVFGNDGQTQSQSSISAKGGLFVRDFYNSNSQVFSADATGNVSSAGYISTKSFVTADSYIQANAFSILDKNTLNQPLSIDNNGNISTTGRILSQTTPSTYPMIDINPSTNVAFINSQNIYIGTQQQNNNIYIGSATSNVFIDGYKLYSQNLMNPFNQSDGDGISVNYSTDNTYFSGSNPLYGGYG